MMTMTRWWAVGLVLVLASCGGGGGDAGSSNFAGSTPTTGDTTGGTTGGTSTPVASTSGSPAAITFASVAPADAALVVRGAGGAGRLETGTVTFKVVSAAGSAVSGATVNFALSAGTDAVLSASSGTTDASGNVVVGVRSGLLSTPFEVTATVAGVTGVSTRSNRLQVSNGPAIANGFELVADKYNLDGGNTGDTTTLTIFARDANGNPVPDGLTVSFTTDNGAVATSTRGGCLTVNGQCTVDFIVQEPRGSGIATVVATALGDGGALLSASVPIYMATPAGSRVTLTDGVTTLTSVALSVAQNCATTLEVLAMDGNDRALAAGSTVSTSAPSTGISGSVLFGSPVDDQLSLGSPPNRLTLQLSSSVVAGVAPAPSTCRTGSFKLVMTTPNLISVVQNVTVTSTP
jgi:hypothetical protein